MGKKAGIGIVAVVIVAAMVGYGLFGADTSDGDGSGQPDPMMTALENAQTSQLEGEVTIGLILPLTGDLATHGKENLEGSKLGVSDFNAHMEELGEPWHLKMVSEDSATNPVMALEKLTSLNAKGIGVVIGPETSSNIRNIMGYANAHNMLLISCCSSAPALAIPDDSVYRLVPNDSNQGTALAKLLRNEGIEVMVPVWRGDTWGDGLQEAAADSFRMRGGIVDEGIRYNPEIPEFSASTSLLSQTVQEHIDEHGAGQVAVLFLGFAEILQFMQSASEHGPLDDIRWFGPGANTKEHKLIDDPIGLEFSTAIQFTTVQVAASKSQVYERVQAYLTETLGTTPNTFVHSSYDAPWLVGLSMLATQSDDVTDIKAVFSEVAAEYHGAIGNTKLNAAGDLAQANYEVWGIRGGEWVLLGQYNYADDSISLNQDLKSKNYDAGSEMDAKISYEDVLCDSKNKNVVNRLNEIISISEDVGYMCEGVPFGSTSGFADFSKYMQNLDDVLLLQGTDPIEINSEIRGFFDQVESSCYDHQDDVLEDVLTEAQLKYGMMGLCLDDMYLEFGDFPAMNIGLSPEYITKPSPKSKNSDTVRDTNTSKISNTDVFCDSKNKNVVNQLNLISSLSERLGSMCESVPFGSTSGFMDFSRDMQNINDELLMQDTSPLEFNSATRVFFDQVEASCYDTNDGALEDVLNRAQFKYAMMGACFDDMYLEFGDFPAMNIGLSPEYITKAN